MSSESHMECVVRIQGRNHGIQAACPPSLLVTLTTKLSPRALTEPTNTERSTSSQAACVSCVAARTIPLSSMRSTKAASWPSQSSSLAMRGSRLLTFGQVLLLFNNLCLSSWKSKLLSLVSTSVSFQKLLGMVEWGRKSLILSTT